MNSLARLFVRARGDEQRGPTAASDRLEALLADGLKAAHEAWPGVLLDPEVFIGALAERSSEAELERLRIADLYLACACSRGDPSALAYFERTILPAATDPVARTRPSAHFAQELRQTVRTRLLLAEPGGVPKISGYAGRAPLVHWVRAVAARAAINLERGAGDHAGEDDLERVPLAAPDPELQALRSRYREPFQAAFRAALAELTNDERTLLRLHFVEGLSHAQVARLRQVHQTTVSRHLSAARTGLLARIRAYLTEQLRVSPQELDSIVRYVRSELDVSMGALLPRPSHDH